MIKQIMILCKTFAKRYYVKPANVAEVEYSMFNNILSCNNYCTVDLLHDVHNF